MVGPISWSVRLQPTITASTTETGYTFATNAIKETLWLRKLLPELCVHVSTITVMSDKQGVVKLLKHPIASVRSKHIDGMHHFAREHVSRGEVQFQYCSTEQMVADSMTKALSLNKSVFYRTSMGVVS